MATWYGKDIERLEKAAQLLTLAGCEQLAREVNYRINFMLANDFEL